MATLASLAIDLTANSAKMVTELQKANGHLNGFAKTAETAGKVAKVAFVAATTGMFANMVKESVDAADRIGKLSQRLGISTEALSEFQHVAELSGVSFNTMTMGLQRMTRRLAEAGATGKGEAVPALQELGISAQKIAQLAPEQQFEIIADALSKLSNEGDRVRLAMKFFDSEGVALVQTMGQGAEGIRAMREEAQKLGLSLSSQETKAAADFNDQMTRAQGTLNALAKEVAINSVTAFNSLTEAFNAVSNEAGAGAPDLEQIQDIIKGAGAAAFVGFNGLQAMAEGIVALTFAVSEALSGNFSGAATELEEGFRRMNAQITEAIEGVDKLYNFSGGEGGGDEGPTGSRDAVKVKAPVIEDVSNSDEKENPLKRILGDDPEKVLENLEKQFMSEEELLTANYEKTKADLEAYAKFDAKNAARYEDLKLKNYEKYLKEKERLKKQSNQSIWTEDQKLQRQTLSATAAFFGVMAQENKDFAIAQALINTYLGVSESLAAYPMPVAAIMAATHLAAGIQNVNAIRSSASGSPARLSSGSATTIGTTTTVDGTETFIEQTSTFVPENTLNVNLNIDDEALLTKNQLRQIIDQINEAEESNVRINI